ncbi:MAG TPA: type VI secretion system baseplate subunit TssE [Polyangiaceae bacterium]|nr:type VI secretion system baseplate subunit TssE [Polyangiaceae bacterium]
MAELTPTERLQPSLLDRLTDDEPTVKVEGPDKSVLSMARLRESVRRDLGFLLNATHLAAIQDLQDYPDAERSTLNYGIPDLAGRPASTVDAGSVARVVRRAILDFEPRLLGPSLKVQVTVSPEQFATNALRLDIEAQLWSQPVPLRLRWRADLSLEDGEAQVLETAG